MFTGRVCKGSPFSKVNFRREITNEDLSVLPFKVNYLTRRCRKNSRCACLIRAGLLNGLKFVGNGAILPQLFIPILCQQDAFTSKKPQEINEFDPLRLVYPTSKGGITCAKLHLNFLLHNQNFHRLGSLEGPAIQCQIVGTIR